MVLTSHPITEIFLKRALIPTGTPDPPLFPYHTWTALITSCYLPEFSILSDKDKKCTNNQNRRAKHNYTLGSIALHSAPPKSIRPISYSLFIQWCRSSHVPQGRSRQYRLYRIEPLKREHSGSYKKVDTSFTNSYFLYTKL